jgi:hypothetical protein
MNEEERAVTDALDRALAQALAANVRDRVPAWYDPHADEDLYNRVVRRAQPRSARRPELWRWAAAVLAVVLVGAAAVTHARSGAPNVGSADTALEATLAQDTGAILNQTVPAGTVRLILPEPSQAVLTHVTPGRWRTITFQSTAGVWTPVSLTTVVAGTPLTYLIYTGPKYPNVVLSPTEMQVIERRLAQLPYAPRDT